MAMVRRGISFQNSVVEVLDGRETQCEKCNSILNMMSSTNGNVICKKCGHLNKVKNMENSNEQ